jgi:hypothetical protein
MRSFSYKEYQYLINWLQSKYKFYSFFDIDESVNSYCIIRHDVEFSIDRALSLAFIEKSLNVQSTYFIQIRNNTYNALSNENIKKIQMIADMGHHIGLHVHTGLLNEYSSIEDLILQDITILSKMINRKVNVFSYHRPTIDLLLTPVNIDGYLNAYDDVFFHAYDTQNIPVNLNVKYISDSNHMWKYGYPTTVSHPKLQINFHPFSWSESGYENTVNFKTLIDEKHHELVISMNNEIKTFPIELL